MSSPTHSDEDIEIGTKVSYHHVPQIGEVKVRTSSYDFFEREDKMRSFLSYQYPKVADPTPLGLSAFALTCLVLSLYNAGGLTCKRFAHIFYTLFNFNV